MSVGVRRPKRRSPPATTLVGSDDPVDKGILGKVAHRELTQAFDQAGLPLIAWDADGKVQLANAAAAELLGRSLDDVVGMTLVELATPEEEVDRVRRDLIANKFAAVHTHRMIHVAGGQDLPVLATSRVVEVDERRGGVTAFVSDTELGRLNRSPLANWLDLVPVALGFTDTEWTIESVSAEIEDLIDLSPRQARGRNLLELMDPEDAAGLPGTESIPCEPCSLPRVRFKAPSGDTVEVCMLLACRATPPGVSFALVGRIESYYPQQSDRVAELELRLRRIGAEVRAAGLIGLMPVPSLRDHPELEGLSTRQWEILSRLLRGDRVATIAGELFISRSTVRNHLATIFQRFGVHSQRELLERLRDRTP